MYKILCVSNSRICTGDFLSHIELLAQSEIYGIILREKHLTEREYIVLAEKVIKICNKYNKLCILHNFIDVAIQLNHNAIHLPMPVLESSQNKLKSFNIVGASVHSVEQAQQAEKLGATYITYGHIFATNCKKGLPPKGINSIKNVAKSVSIPVYPLGGVNKENINFVKQQGTGGCAVMSGLMTDDYANILQSLYME